MSDTVNKPIPIDANLSTHCKSFLRSLLTKDPSKRLGGFKENMDKDVDDAEEIRAHPFFEGINWSDV